MARHIELNPDNAMMVLDIASTALQTARRLQTRKAANVYIPSGDGTGVLIGDTAENGGISRYDPESETQSPLWEGISQEELDAKADEILGAAKEDTAAQITIVNTTITEAQQQIEANREGIEQEASLREEGDKRAQDAAAAVKAETDKLATKYDEMDTSVTSVKNDLKNVMTSTSQLEQDMIVSTLIEYAVGDSDTVPPTLSDSWGPTTPERTPGTYIWMRTQVTFGDGGQETSAPVLVTGNTGAQGPQGAAGAKGDVGEDGKTYYTYFAYGTSASGANFSTTPTSSSTYIGVCITLDTTQPTTPASYTWSLTKGNQGAPGAQGVSVSALTPFWQLDESKPAQPVNKSPGGGWTSTEPAYVRGKKLWTCSRIDYSNGQWSWTSVQQSSAFEAAELALTTANGKNRRYVQPSTPDVDTSELTQGDEWWQTSSKPPETYWMGTPNNSVSVLVDHSNEVEHIWVWNGTRWALNRLSAEDIIVSGSIAAGLVTADFFDGARIMGGEFVTSNELIHLNNAGLVMDGKSGERLVTLNATDGTATFQHVAIINGSLSVPTIEGGTINGAAFNLTDASGSIIGRLNSSGISFGDKLTFAKKSGEWVLSLKGAIQSGGEISGPVITAPTIQTSGAENTGLKFTTGGLVAFDANGNTTFTLDNTGGIMMAGALLSNATLTAPTITTSPDADNRVSITSAGLTVTHGGQTVISFAADGAVDLGTSGIAADSRVSDLTDEVHDSYTPLATFTQTTDALGESVTNVQTQVDATVDRLDAEINDRRQYMRFDPNNGLTIGDLTATDAYSVQLTSTMMQFRAGSSVAAYVSNDRLYINNADILSTLRIGRFAWIPRANGHMSLQYVGDMGVTATPTEEEANDAA